MGVIRDRSGQRSRSGRAGRLTLALVLGALLWGPLEGCEAEEAEEGDRVNRLLTAGLLLPDDGEELEDPPTDSSVELPGPSSAPVLGVGPGQVVLVSIPFTAPQANVVGAGIRFGPDAAYRVVSIPEAEGLTAGTLRFEFQVPFGICADIAQVCHDIQCYEVAVTSAGEISRATITDLALVCGSCDEPSCQSLLTAQCQGECFSSADCESGESCQGGTCVGDGALRFTLRWAPDTDVDLHVTTPEGTEISYLNRVAGGAELDVDDTGSGPSGNHVENIFLDAPASGTYEFWAVNYSGSQSVGFTLEVAEDGSPVRQETGTLSAEGGAESSRFSHSF